MEMGRRGGVEIGEMGRRGEDAGWGEWSEWRERGKHTRVGTPTMKKGEAQRIRLGPSKVTGQDTIERRRMQRAIYSMWVERIWFVRGGCIHTYIRNRKGGCRLRAAHVLYCWHDELRAHWGDEAIASSRMCKERWGGLCV